jgi:hypothetical protein
MSEELLQERDALRDEVEGLKAGVDTVMRALKIALKEHNQALSREGVLLDLLRQAEGEFAQAANLLHRFYDALAAGGVGDRLDLASLVRELEACPWFQEEEENGEAPEDGEEEA